MITLTLTHQEIETIKRGLRSEVLLTEEDQHYAMLDGDEEMEIDAVQRRRAARSLLRKLGRR